MKLPLDQWPDQLLGGPQVLEGFGFKGPGLKFRVSVWGLEFRVWGKGSRVEGLGLGGRGGGGGGGDNMK